MTTFLQFTSQNSLEKKCFNTINLKLFLSTNNVTYTFSWNNLKYVYLFFSINIIIREKKDLSVYFVQTKKYKKFDKHTLKIN